MLIMYKKAVDLLPLVKHNLVYDGRGLKGLLLKSIANSTLINFLFAGKLTLLSDCITPS